MENGGNYVIYRFFFCQDPIFSKIHKTVKKSPWPKPKNLCLMILNDKLNCQVSSIFMNPQSIHVETLREWISARNACDRYI
jgi:hypothetical protein